LAGDPHITALTLFEPRINLISADNVEEAQAVTTLLTNFLRSDRRPSLTALRVLGGDVTLDGARWLEDLNITVGNVARSDLRVAASGRYRGQPLRLSAVVAGASVPAHRPIIWQLQAGDLAAGFDGVLLSPPSLDAEGRLSVVLAAGALRSRPLSLPREAALLLDGVTVGGNARMILPAVQLRDVVIARGQNRLQGALELNLAPSDLRLGATLHSDSLDMSVLGRGLADALAVPGWREVLLGRAFSGGAWLAAVTADIRLSVGRIALGSVTVSDAALSAKLGHGRFEVAMSNARVAGGSVKGRVNLWSSGEQISLRAALQADQIDAGVLPGPAAGRILSGTFTGQAAVEGTGASASEMLRRSDGRGSFSLRDGEFSGLDAERFLRRADAAQATLPDGRSRFQLLNTAWRLNQGVVTITEGVVRGLLWQGQVEGSADLNGGGLLDFLARLSLEGPESAREQRLIRLQGPFASPLLGPAGAIPFRRSMNPVKKSGDDG
jgi:AsmA family